MTAASTKQIQQRLRLIVTEMKRQTKLAAHYGEDSLSFDDEISQIREYLSDANEYGLAYEIIVANLEQIPFTLSGKAAVALLEVGLLLGYKTEAPGDEIFDRRQ